MRGVNRFFIIIIGTLVIAACSSPIGSIGRSGAYQDGLWVVPTRTQYEVTDRFQRENDLHVFLSDGGSVLPISVEDVDISVIENLDNGTQLEIDEDGTYTFQERGRKIIVVDYNGMNPAQYSVMVNDPNSINEGGDTEGTGVFIDWANGVDTTTP